MAIIEISQIKPNPKQPRKSFVGIAELAESIKDKGLLTPIMVRPVNGHFEIIHGERRWRAAQMAGLTQIDAVVKDSTEKEAYEMALVENIQRQDLNAIEEGQAFKELQDQGYKQSDIARMIGKGQSYVAHKIRLLKLPEPIAFYLVNHALSENHIRQVMRLEDIYGADLLRGLPAKMNLPSIESEEAAVMLLVYCRPEERVLLFKPSGTVIEACRTFAEYVLKHNSEVRQWEVAGFWWASLAASYDLTVSEFTLALDRWRERYESVRAQWWCYYEGGKSQPKNREELDIYWGIFGDLRHSASLHVDDDILNQAPEKFEAYAERLQRLTECAYYPSTLADKETKRLREQYSIGAQ